MTTASPPAPTPGAPPGGPTTADSQLEAGARLGDFVLERLLGQGPLGDVFAAKGKDGAPALVRVLARRIAARPELRERIGRDLHTLRAVDHPAVARVLAIGEERGHVYYGLADPGPTSLGELVRRGRPLDARELVWLGAGVAGGLAALHAAGLAHGSLAPHTVFVAARGPVLVDLAWTVRLHDASGVVPAGEPPPPSVPHDLRALGLLLVLAATGALPTDPGKRELPAAVGPRLAALVDLLLGPADKRPPAEKVARLFAQMAKEAGVEGQPPAPLLELADRVGRGEAPAGVDPSAAPTLGRFGRYVLLEEIGRGGMGVVYRARHADFERFFALKVMLAGALADDTARRRFLHEAEAAAGLDHPAIVRVHDCGVVDGRAYLAMDLTVGRPLTEVYRDEARPLAELLTLFLDVVRAVHYAHSRGIIHRDLKPENVLIDSQGQPHILDFGVAKRVDEASGMLTVQGELVGTPAYMPPEQAEGRGNDIDTRSDVYALGASLFEVVTRGRLPFEGKTVTDTLTRILLEEPPVPSALRPGLPWEVDAIVLKALEKRRERRYQSAAELAEDLERWLAGQPIRARQATWSYRAKKWLVRRWPVVTGVALVASVGLGGSAVVVARRRAEVARRVAEGDEAFARGDVRAALERYAQALALDADHVGASVGRERANASVEEAERVARRRREREKADQFVRLALEREAQGDLKAARAAYEQATAFEGAPEAAREGLRKVERALTEQEVLERRGAVQAADSGRSRAALEEGTAHEQAGRLEAAQASYLQALGFGATEARAALARVDGALVAARATALQAELQAALREKAAADAAARVADGQRALDADALDDARRAFLQALGFDGTNQAAQEGLLEVDRLQRARADQAERAARLRQAIEQLRLARDLHATGRTKFREGEELEAVREAYFQSLDAYDKALFLVPDHQDARREKGAVAREVAVILRDEGHHDLADFLLRLGGVSGDTAAVPELPTDPHLVVVEADKISVRRAFGGGVVRFVPTRVFDRLREQVRARGGGRFRVEIQVRSEATASIPPLVLAKGLWVRVEDTVAHTVSPVVKVDFEGGPFARQVTVDARGRIVAPFERARDLPAQRYIDAAEAAARRLLADAEARVGGR